MKDLRTSILIFLISWPLLLMSQSQDFQIRNFHESMTDLSAISSNVKDNNGKPTALIRFTVRDSKFEFNANLGIVKQERKTGEVWLYVPVGTKRLTISHPHLGVLRGYQIPISVEGKCTYDAEIVITNKVYLESLYGKDTYDIPPLQPEVEIVQQPEIKQSEEQQSVETSTETSAETIDETSNETSDEPKPKAKSKTFSNLASLIRFHAGVGINAINVTGPSLQLGISYKIFALEGGFIYGLDQVKDIGFKYGSSSSLYEAYDYSCSKAWLRLGVNFDSGKFQISPRAGVTFNMISGKEVSGVHNSSNIFKESNPMAVFAALRLSYKVINHLRIHLTPQYDFTIGGDQVFEVIKQGDSKIKGWGDGFGINVGLIYEF